jgi:hypothetical protein
MPLSILVAVANRPELRDQLAEQLTADGHDVRQTHHSRYATALLAGRSIDVLILARSSTPPRRRRCCASCAPGRSTRAWLELPT